jgi:hypothetical protein
MDGLKRMRLFYAMETPPQLKPLRAAYFPEVAFPAGNSSPPVESKGSDPSAKTG